MNILKSRIKKAGIQTILILLTLILLTFPVTNLYSGTKDNNSNFIVQLELGPVWQSLNIGDFLVQLIGPIRQEILSGIKSEKQYEKLKNHLRSFPDYQIQTKDFELAAQFINQCRSKGIQGSNTDLLICSVAVNNNWQVFTNDQDFSQFQQIIPVKLYKAAS